MNGNEITSEILTAETSAHWTRVGVLCVCEQVLGRHPPALCGHRVRTGRKAAARTTVPPAWTNVRGVLRRCRRRAAAGAGVGTNRTTIITVRTTNSNSTTTGAAAAVEGLRRAARRPRRPPPPARRRRVTITISSSFWCTTHRHRCRTTITSSLTTHRPRPCRAPRLPPRRRWRHPGQRWWWWCRRLQCWSTAATRCWPWPVAVPTDVGCRPRLTNRRRCSSGQRTTRPR